MELKKSTAIKLSLAVYIALTLVFLIVGIIEISRTKEVRQIELLCKQLYDSQDPNIREQAEKAVVAFQESPDTLSKCQALLERADSSYSQLLAATTLAKLLSRSTTSLSVQQRLDIRNYVLNYLATRPKLAAFVIQSLVSLFARITKLGWFDMVKEEYVFRNVMNDVSSFLQVNRKIQIRIP
ncbi:Exportin-7 [Papilio xuthus]|uniref:Exportin-7 n=1 Tax=Papilio xuthus TaxID=66420 RepID=A0A0N1PIN1_PAPXU|nr:Exportin-7 [Papilio xuthus]